MASPQPAMSGNQSRSSSVGSVQMRSMSCIMREAERVGIDAAVARIVEVRLAASTLVCECRNSRKAPSLIWPLLVQAVHDVVVAEGGAALVHHLGLALRIEILRDHGARCAGSRAARAAGAARSSPGNRGGSPAAVRAGRGGAPRSSCRLGRGSLRRQGAPEVVVGLLPMALPLPLAPLLGAQVGPLLARIAVDAVATSAHGRRRARARPRPGRSAPRSARCSPWRTRGSRGCRRHRSIAWNR